MTSSCRRIYLPTPVKVLAKISSILAFTLSISSAGSSGSSSTIGTTVVSSSFCSSSLSSVTSSFSHASRIFFLASKSSINFRSTLSVLGMTMKAGIVSPVIFAKKAHVFCRSSVSFKFSKRLNSFRFCSLTSLLMILMSWLALSPVASLNVMICLRNSFIWYSAI